MNRSDIRALVVDATGRADKDTEINNAINLAVGEVSAARNWSDLFVESSTSVTASSLSVLLDTDLARLVELRVLDTTASLAWRLSIRTKQWLLRRVPYPPYKPVGKPRFGYLEGKTLYLYPVPDIDYVFRYSYFRLHPKLVNDSSEILIRQADSAVAAFATYWILQSLERQVEADKWFVTYTRVLKSAMEVDKGNTVVKIQVSEHADEFRYISQDYKNDPFARSMP